MGFFCVLREPGEIDFNLEKLDINLWVLPGLAGRRVVLCDVGLKIRVGNVLASGGNNRLGLRLGLPLTVEDKVRDLTHLFYDDRNIANLVFGNDAVAPSASQGVYRYDDGDDDIILAPVDLDHCVRQAEAIDRPFSLWRIRTERPVSEDEIIYIRVRFRARDAGKAWAWQRIGFRRSFAFADLRLNEFRDRPRLDQSPDYVNNAKDVSQFNLFLITSSKLKSGRVSPQPRYVRLHEGILWERYLGRQLGRRRSEVFVITYWRADNIRSTSQFRSFLEVERRRPTASRAALIASIVSVVGFVLLTTPRQLEDSLLWSIISSGYTLVGGISLAAVLAAIRLALQFSARIHRLRTWLRRLEDRRFKPETN